jgi:hypothetical protein
LTRPLRTLASHQRNARCECVACGSAQPFKVSGYYYGDPSPLLCTSGTFKDEVGNADCSPCNQNILGGGGQGCVCVRVCMGGERGWGGSLPPVGLCDSVRGCGGEG